MYSNYDTSTNMLLDEFVNKTTESRSVLAYVKIQTPSKETIKIMVDSGSTLCLMNVDTFNQFQCKLNSKEKTEITVANGSTTGTLGSSFIPLKFKHFTLVTEFHIVKNLPVSAILGFDVMKNLVLDFPNRILRHPEKKYEIPISIEAPYVHTTNFVMVNEDYAVLDKFHQDHIRKMEHPMIWDNKS